MTTEQLDRWCTSVLALLNGGMHNVDEIIKARGGARMSTLVAIKHLINIQSIFRMGNDIYKMQ
jgi:hypothetical protein